jgi:hypothetical protein
MRLVIAASLTIVVGCAHSSLLAPRLSSAVTLEAQLDSVQLRHGLTAKVRFLLRNASTEPVEFCLLEGGITTSIRLEGRLVPLRGYGAGSDAGCNRVRLLARQAREFTEEFPVWPCPTAGDFVGSIRLYSPDGADEADVCSAPLPVTISESEVAPLPTRCASESKE